MELFQFLTNEPKEFLDIKNKYNKNNKLQSIPKNSYPVKCHNGIFVGKEEENIISFKGIPFAKPPIKKLRWKPALDCENSMIYLRHFIFKKVLFK